MFTRRLILATMVALFCADSVWSQVLYRETFPATPAPNRGDNVLDQGWDVTRNASGGEGLVDIIAGLAPDDVTPINQNSAAIFGNSDTDPNGDDVGTVGNPASGGVNNSPFLPENPVIVDPDTQEESLTYGDGILFASRGFFTYLFSTEEVPGGTQASDVNYVRWRGRNNPARTDDPFDQSIHGAVKVGGTWFVHETGLVDQDSSAFKIGQIDISAGNWAELSIASVDLSGQQVETPTSVTLGLFDQAKPIGDVEAWGVVNAQLTNNTRFDYIEFGSDMVQTSIPEPASITILAIGGVALAARLRRNARKNA